jgi:hypothetical protein
MFALRVATRTSALRLAAVAMRFPIFHSSVDAFRRSPLDEHER